ncbi:MAG: hypothetical protein JO272_04140 [Pseudonocardiales bacterium]|nr:hypothetical protein [Pseudonocardiales bacterium]
MKTTIDTITTEKGRPADASVIWFHHVNLWTWIGMGAKPHTITHTQDGLMVDIYLGAGFCKRRLVIKVNRYDLYDIEIGRIHRRTLEWIPVAQTRDVYADDLDQEIRDLYDANAV